MAQAVAPAVEVPVKALLHAVLLQKGDDLRAQIAVIPGRIVQKTELFRLPAAFREASSRISSRRNTLSLCPPSSSS